MAAIRINLEDHTGNTSNEAKVANDATIARLLQAIVNKLGLPRVNPAGRTLNYQLGWNGRQLSPDETLSSAGVIEGDTITIVPEVIAGGLQERPRESVCSFFGAERQQIIRDITDAVEGRLLVTIVAERERSERASRGVHTTIMVRPVFGTLLSDIGFAADVFMLMPFSDRFTSVYRDYVTPVVLDAGLKISRADDFFSRHNIMNEIWTALFKCRFAIAECSGRNPNVMYELGIAHTIGKAVILLAQDASDIPFDIQGRRVIIYEDRSSGLTHLQQQLKQAIRHLLNEQEASRAAVDGTSDPAATR